MTEEPNIVMYLLSWACCLVIMAWLRFTIEEVTKLRKPIWRRPKLTVLWTLTLIVFGVGYSLLACLWWMYKRIPGELMSLRFVMALGLLAVLRTHLQGIEDLAVKDDDK